MGDVILFTPRSGLDAKANLKDFVDYCKDELKLYEDQGGFSVNAWKFDNKGRNVSITFNRYTEVKNPYSGESFSEPFLSFAKAYIRYHQSLKQVSSVTDKLVVLRAIYDSLIAVHDCSDILKLDGLVQLKAVEILNARYSGSAKLYHYGGQLEVLYEFLVTKRLVSNLTEWKRPWRKAPEKAIRVDAESRKWQESRCPSMHQMIALADSFSRATTVKDRYWSSVLALLMFAPSRGGELSELTINSLYDEDSRLAVVWYGEKGFGESLKWVPREMESVVREAFERLIEIGGPAREAAKFAYENPGQFKPYGEIQLSNQVAEDQPLNAVEFAYAMGFSQETIERLKAKTKNYNSVTAWNVLGAHQVKWIQDLRTNGNPTYKDLAAYIGGKYQTKSWPRLPRTDRFIWESLLLVRDNEFHETFQPKYFSWTMPSVNQLNDQLSARPMKNMIPTIFQRFGHKNEDGTNIELSSHQLRVWLSTHAERGGMDSWRLAQWAGRARVQDNRAYDLRTQEERSETANALLVLEDRPSVLAAIKVGLPVGYDQLGIDRIGIADVTEYGMCVHDYAMAPCTKGGECMTCKEHVCIKGMPKTLDRIKSLEEKVCSQFNKAKSDEGAGVFGADRWITHLGWKLAHIRTQRERLESEDTPDGAVLWIAPEHDPSPIKRSLMQKGYKTESEKSRLVDRDVIRMLLEE